MTTIIVSGYFNPIHVGHLDYLEAAKELGGKVIVIVNNDEQVALKGSTPFMNERDRLRIVDALWCVDEAVLSIDKDEAVTKTISMIADSIRSWDHQAKDPIIFANGGDRVTDVPEVKFCGENNIKCEFNVGGEKSESSSGLISRAISQ